MTTMRNLLMLMCAVIAAVTLAACGGGEPAPIDPNTQPLAAGSYKLAFSAISTARLAAPISGIDVSVKLPVGLLVSTDNGGASGQITTSSLTPGSAFPSGSALIFGNYSASTRTAYLTMATSLDTYRGGQYLNLLFTVPTGAVVTPNDIFNLNLTYPLYKVVGFDAITHSSVDMTGSVKTTLGVAP